MVDELREDMDEDVLTGRLATAYRVETVPADVRRDHLSVLRGELSRRRPRTGRLRRRAVVTLVAATVTVLPVGVAAAAQGAVPGDVLYPVKLATERVQRLVDRDVASRHRVEELEVLLERRAGTERHRRPSDTELRNAHDRARDAVRTASPPVVSRFERAASRLRVVGAPPAVEPSPPAPAPERPTAGDVPAAPSREPATDDAPNESADRPAARERAEEAPPPSRPPTESGPSVDERPVADAADEPAPQRPSSTDEPPSAPDQSDPPRDPTRPAGSRPSGAARS